MRRMSKAECKVGMRVTFSLDGAKGTITRIGKLNYVIVHFDDGLCEPISPESLILNADQQKETNA